MSSLVYLVATGAKNSLKEMLHKPGKLILYLFVVAMIAGMVVLSFFTDAAGSDAPLYWLKGIYFAFVALFLVLSVQKGLTSGDAIFEMSDVNLLFVSPVNPRAILLYGLVRLAKVSFWAGFFILFQSNSLANFGVDFGGVLVLFAVFVFTMVVMSLLSLVIYSATNGHPRRKMVVRVLTVLAFVPPVAWFVVQLAGGGDLMAVLASTLQSPLFSAVPIAGWAAGAANAFLVGNLAGGFAWLGLLLLAGGGMLCYVMLSKADYYEDVLVATETAFEKKRAVEEGDINAATTGTAGKVKVTKTGLRGAGATAIFYKHLRETFRQSRLGFFSLYTIIMFIGVMALAIFLRGEVDVVVVLQILMWMQIFLATNGRGSRELYMHYIYLIPEPAFKKVVWSNMELVFKTLLESILLLGIPGLVMDSNLAVILLSMAVYTLFTMLMLGINYLSMRWTGASLSGGLLLTIYFMAVVLVMLPGLVPALIVGFMVGGVWGTLLGLLILAGWELLAALGCFALSRGVLHRCDMPTVKPGGK